MSSQTKRITGFLLDMESKKIITESTVDIVLTSPLNPDGPYSLKGVLITNGYKPELHLKQYLLNLNNKISWIVRITLQDLFKQGIETRFDIWFEDSAWHNSVDWFETL
ncbi:MAG: hypothetical protein ABSG01_15590 [Anaerolineales bacterium]|jgi:hypothetical protein